MRGPDDGAGPVLLTDHLAALLAQDPIHAETHDRPEVSEQDAGTGLTSHVPTFPVRRFGGQRLRGSHSGTPCLPVRSSLAVDPQVDALSGHFELGDSLPAIGRAREQAVFARRQALEV